MYIRKLNPACTPFIASGLPLPEFPSLETTVKELGKSAEVYPGLRFGRRPLILLWKNLIGRKDCRILQQTLAGGEKTLGDCMKKGWRQYMLGRRDSALRTGFEIVCRKNPDCPNPIDRSAVLLYSLAQIYRQTFQGEIDRNPDKDDVYDYTGRIVQRYPLDMDGYRGIFSACRLPGKWEDEIRYFLWTFPRHVSIGFQDRIFLLEVFDTQNNPLPPEILAGSLSAIRKCAEFSPPSGFPTPLLGSALRRSEWYRLRQQLRQSPRNAAHLQMIESAMVHLILDDGRPQSEEEILCGMLHDPRDAFFGKTQLRVFANGEAAFGFEHALTNGSETACMVNDRLEPLEQRVTRDWFRRGRRQTEISGVNPCLLWEIDALLEGELKRVGKKVNRLLGDRITRLESISVDPLWRQLGENHARKLVDWIIQISFMTALHTVDPDHGGVGVPVHTRAIGGYLDIASGFSREISRLAQALATRDENLEEPVCRSREQYREMILASKRGSGANSHLMAISGLSRNARMQAFLQKTFCFLSGGLSEVINPRSISSNGGQVRAFTTIETDHPNRLVMGFAVDRQTHLARCHFKAGIGYAGRLEILVGKMQEYLNLIVQNLPNS